MIFKKVHLLALLVIVILVSACDSSLKTDSQSIHFIEVINRPGELSAVWRTKIDDRSHRRYYLIVEAVSKSGEKKQLSILNHETGETETVNKWGIGVSSEIYEKFKLDKQDDGEIQGGRIGRIQGGSIQPVYDIETSGLAITSW